MTLAENRTTVGTEWVKKHSSPSYKSISLLIQDPRIGLTKPKLLRRAWVQLRIIVRAWGHQVPFTDQAVLFLVLNSPLEKSVVRIFL